MTSIQSSMYKFSKTVVASRRFYNLSLRINVSSKSPSDDCRGKKFDPCSSTCGEDKPSICKEQLKKETCQEPVEDKDVCKPYFSKVSESSKTETGSPCVCEKSVPSEEGTVEPENQPCDPCCPSYKCPVCNPSKPSLYDCRKYGHNLPSNNVVPFFEPLPQIPSGVFRCTSNEVLGPWAQKCSYYQQPEYFSYHHMTYYDMHHAMRCYRNPSPKTGRKP